MAKETEKETEKETDKKAEKDAGTPREDTEGLWICPWCHKDIHSERNYYYHLKHCDACPEDGKADSEHPSLEQMKKEEPFIINIFEGPTKEEKPPEKEEPPEKKEEEMKTPNQDKEPPYRCGYCGAGMEKKYKHCPECGQALEWASDIGA